MQDLRFFRNHYRQRDLLHAVNLMCSFKYHSFSNYIIFIRFNKTTRLYRRSIGLLWF